MADSDISLEPVVAAHQEGRLEEAEAGYAAFLDSHPDDPDALHFLGLLRMHQRRPDEAIELVRRSLSLLPTNPHAWNNLGNLLVAVGREEEALSAYERAAGLTPHLLEAIHNVGVLLRKRRRPEEAVGAFMRVIAANPRFSPAWEHLTFVLYRLGRTEEAAAAYRKWLELEPDNPVPRHMLAATSGEAPPERAGSDYLARTFDQFADSFDSSLEDLGYVAPQLLAAIVGEHVDVGRGNLDILDAGCGTGLCGLLLRTSARKLVGVDLSSGMLEKARERKIYDDLALGDLCEFMRSRAAAFDVVVSGDTLCYFGNLDEPIMAARRALRPGGVFAFTVEAVPADSREEFRLLANGRYAHGQAYIASRVEAGGFENAQLENAVLRKELGEDVAGFAVVGRAPR